MRTTPPVRLNWKSPEMKRETLLWGVVAQRLQSYLLGIFIPNSELQQAVNSDSCHCLTNRAHQLLVYRLLMGLSICKRQRAWLRHRKSYLLINIGSNSSVSVNKCIASPAWDMPPWRELVETEMPRTTTLEGVAKQISCVMPWKMSMPFCGRLIEQVMLSISFGVCRICRMYSVVLPLERYLGKVVSLLSLSILLGLPWWPLCLATDCYFLFFLLQMAIWEDKWGM